MVQLSAHDIMILFLALGTLLLTARVLGEVAMRFGQPAVLGELLAGILLGPTILGSVVPQVTDALFPATGPVPVVLAGLSLLAITLFLLVAGIEVDLSTMWRQGRVAVVVGLMGILVPFSLGFGAAWCVPRLLGAEPTAGRLLFALFFATALSISALPVIAKTLMDLNLYRSDLGMVVVAAAVFNDLIGWLIFAVVLSLMPQQASAEAGMPPAHAGPVGTTIGLTCVLTVFMLTLGRWAIHRSLPWIQAHTSWPGGVLGLSLAVGLFGAALAEWIGIHAIFGAFLVGVAIGDSAHLREQTRTIINDFVCFIFAPLFFAMIGLHVNFVDHFDLSLILAVLVIACIGKIVGCGLGARLAGLPRREAWAVGFGMNARGAMEIILGLLALQAGLIGERMFVALVIMALVTSMISGPMMQRILGLARPRRLMNHVTARSFVCPMQAGERFAAITELAEATAAAFNLNPAKAIEAVTAREQIMPTGLANRIAVPHARIDGLSHPVVGVGISKVGVDFDAPDGEPAQLIFMILTPTNDDGAQIALLGDIARTFAAEATRQRAINLNSYTEFRALLRTDSKS